MPDRDAYEVLHVHPKAHAGVIKAAYRVLAALYHPDGKDELSSDRRMAELNAAYDRVRTPDRRQLYDEERKRGGPVASVMTPPAPSTARTQTASPGVLEFGRYQGWTIANLARQDPDYLRWLARHSSGAPYRLEIESLLPRAPKVPTTSDRLRRRR